jgi:hypothetical protein
VSDAVIAARLEVRRRCRMVMAKPTVRFSFCIALLKCSATYSVTSSYSSRSARLRSKVTVFTVRCGKSGEPSKRRISSFSGAG